MTQEDVAGAAEIDRSYISEIENARFSASIDLVEKLAEAFGIDFAELFDRTLAARLLEDRTAGRTEMR